MYIKTFVVPAKRMTVLITVLYISLSFFSVFRIVSTVFFDFSQVIHLATDPRLWKSALTDSDSVSNSWFLACYVLHVFTGIWIGVD